MDLLGIEPLTGAYGRFYKSISAMQKDFNEGKDFKMVNGSYCSIRDFKDDELITCRYGRSLRVLGALKTRPKKGE